MNHTVYRISCTLNLSDNKLDVTSCLNMILMTVKVCVAIDTRGLLASSNVCSIFVL